LDVLNAYDFKPLIDGTSLAKALETRPGPWMKEALDVVMKWQLRNPDKGDVPAVISEVQAWKQVNPASTDKKHPQEPPSTNVSATKKQKQGELTSALISHFLRLTLRSIFSQTKHPDLTSTGRRNINSDIARKAQAYHFDTDQPGWSGKQSWALDLLTWVCCNLDPILVEKEWGVLVPPILTILDFPDVQTKATGCKLLKHVLDQTPPALLARTGLAPVFEEALYVCTTYLPSFTSPSDSVTIISTAIPALLSLANARYPNASPERTKFLLTIFRKAFLAPMDHSSEHVVIAEELYIQLPSILRTLGIDSVVHLKDLVPMIARTLDEPLGLAYPPLLLAATKALNILVSEARARIWYWRIDVLKGLCGLWIRLHPLADSDKKETETPEVDKIKEQGRAVIDTLDDAINDDEWTEEDVREKWPQEVTVLIKADERLESLFADILPSKTPAK
jgi:tRNA nucleotidyltransferase (CCA-adding enzyme)